MPKIIVVILLSVYSVVYFSQRENKFYQKMENMLSENRNVDLSSRKTAKHSKLVAAGLNVSLGLFGVHRLYLGTSPKIPVIYTFTLGGGGFLMLTDLGVIIFTKDLEKFSNSEKVIMWSN